MSTAVATPAAPPLSIDHTPTSRSYPALAPSTGPNSTDRQDAMMMMDAPSHHTPTDRSPSDGRKSPKSYVGSIGGGSVTDGSNSIRNSSTTNPKVIVKKEPGSPSIQGSSRHRPRKLDLNIGSTTATTPANTRPSGTTPLTGREGFVMHDVGLACLSPGFQTQDPTMREQLQRSISVRDQQRSIIEARLLKSAKGDVTDKNEASFSNKGGLLSSKKRPPPGLSIVPPSAQQFANERVIQSAPLNQTFTGRNQPPPGSRQNERPPSGYPQGSQLQHVAAVQTNNRLPPISDVFGADQLQPGSSRPHFAHSNSTPHFNGPPLPSPGFPPQTAHPSMQNAGRPREYRSAEEAVQEMTGGREELQPKLVRYGGRQPPTPPSPRNEGLTPHKHHLGLSGPSLTSRRRSRHEYEADSSPPLGTGRDQGPRTGPFGEGRDSPATQKAKKDEFLSLCSRAWDLFHS